MRPSITLYHYWRSSCSWRVRWAFAVKGVPYESVPVNILSGEHTSADHKQRNPMGYLPALKIDGRAFGESLAMLEWIEETWPEPPLMPRDPLDRLYVRQLALTVVSGTQPLQNLSTLKQIAPEDEATRQRLARTFITKGLSTYESIVRASGKGGTYSLAEQLTFADLCLVPQIYNAQRYQVDLAELPLVRRIYETCLKLPSCDRAAPHNQPGAQPTAH